MPPMMPPMPPQGGPPDAGGGGGGGGAIAQVLQSLMQNPAAIKGMQNFMQGQPPTAGMPQPMGLPPGMGPPPGGGGGPPMPPGAGGPPQGDQAEQMANSQIAKAGQTWDGTDAPTKNDIERLKEDPSPSAVKSFDQQFGSGMAEKYIGDASSPDAEDEGDQGDDESTEGDQGSASQPAYDE
jgi:hypothetical protein